MFEDSGVVKNVSNTNPLPVTASITPSGTQDVNLTKVGGTAMALGQQLAAASLPIVLTAAQLTTLTPPAAITGYATETTLSALNTKTPSLGQALAAASIPVVLTAAQLTTLTPNASQPVTNAGTFAVQATLAAETTKVIGAINNLPATVDTNSGAKSASTIRVVLATDQPALTNKLLVTPDSVALPANQSVNISQINGIAPLMGAGNTGTGSPRVTIASDQAALPITTVIPGVAATNLGKAEDSVHASGDTGVMSLGVSNVAQNTLNADGDYSVMATDLKGNLMEVGNIAHDGVDAGNPIKTGGRARTSEIAAVSSDDRVDSIYDKVGKQVVIPYALPENFVSGAITSAMTGTTSTSLVAAPTGSLRNYITTIIVSNSHATVGTDIIIQDGSAGTTLLTIPAAAVYGGAVINLPVPLRQPTTATAIYCANVTTGSSTKVSAVGYT